MSKYMQVLTKVCVIEHRLQRLPSEVQASRRRARRLNEMAPIELQAFSVHLRGWMQGCCCKTTENEHRFSCELLSLQCPRPQSQSITVRPRAFPKRPQSVPRAPWSVPGRPQSVPRVSPEHPQSIPRASPERPKASPERTQSVPKCY